MAVAEVVFEEGYHAASVAKIVGAAGVSRNCFYDHFSNKEECFLAAYDATLARLVSYMHAACDDAQDWPARLEAELGAFLRFSAAEPALAWLCIVEVLAAGPRSLARRDATISAFVARLQRRSENAVPETMTRVLVGGVYELVYTRMLRGESAALPDLLPEIVYVWLAPFLGPAFAAARSAAVSGAPAHLRVAPEPVSSTSEDAGVF